MERHSYLAAATLVVFLAYLIGFLRCRHRDRRQALDGLVATDTNHPVNADIDSAETNDAIATLEGIINRADLTDDERDQAWQPLDVLDENVSLPDVKDHVL